MYHVALGSLERLGQLKIGTLFLVTCLADKTNHPVGRPKSQQSAVW